MLPDFSSVIREYVARTEADGCCAVSTTVVLLVAALGALALLRLVAGAAGALVSAVSPGKDVRKYGEWGVVTGATGAIGFAVAKEFARRGLSVVLVSRSQESLSKCAKELAAAYPRVKVQTVAADFASGDEGMFTRIRDELAGLDVGVLYNNAGLSYDHAEYLHLVSDEQVAGIVDLNVNATTQMTRIVLPGMVERGRGAVVNVASAAGVIPCGDPLYAVYSASKAYVDFFSRSLHYELAAKGVNVQCQIPYFVTSKMSKIRRASLTVPSAATFARSAVNAIGSGGATVVPYLPHRVQHAIMTMLPLSLVSRFVLSHHHSIRKRALAKKARKAE